MKKYLVMIIVFMFFLISCGEKNFDLEEAKEKIVNMGYVIQNEYVTEDEIEKIDSVILRTMKYDGYDVNDLDLGVNYYIKYWMEKYPITFSYDWIEIICFENDDKAKQLYEYFIESRDSTATYKCRLSGSYVISCKNENVMKELGGKFK